MEKFAYIIITILTISLLFFVFENNKLKQQLNTKPDTVKVIIPVNIEPPPVIIDSLPAVIGLRKSLLNNAKEINRLREAYLQLEQLYVKLLNDTLENQISLPVATLDTAIARYYDNEGRLSCTFDSLHTEYLFPPINSFMNTRIKLGILPTKIEFYEIEKVIYKKRSILWDIGIFLTGYATRDIIQRIK